MHPSKKTLVLGASPNPRRYAYIVTEMLWDYGNEVVLFGIKKGNISDQTILNEWPTDMDIDTITMYVNPTIQENYYDRIIQMKPNRIIFNPGTENPEFQKKVKDLGIKVQNACTLVLLRTNQY